MLEKNGVENYSSKNGSSAFANASLEAWSETGNCIRGSGNCAMAIVGGIQKKSEGYFPINLSIIDNDKILIKYSSEKKSDDNSNVLNFRNDVLVPSTISENLDKSSITILTGGYEITHSEDGSKTVIVRATIE